MMPSAPQSCRPVNLHNSPLHNVQHSPNVCNSIAVEMKLGIWDASERERRLTMLPNCTGHFGAHFTSLEPLRHHAL